MKNKTAVQNYRLQDLNSQSQNLHYYKVTTDIVGGT